MSSTVQTHHIFYKETVPVSRLSMHGIFIKDMDSKTPEVLTITAIDKEEVYYRGLYKNQSSVEKMPVDTPVLPLHSVINVQLVEGD